MPIQSVITMPLKPQSWRSIFVSRSWCPIEYWPFTLLYDDITVQGWLSLTAISNPRRYSSRAVRGDTRSSTLVRFVSCEFTA